ncbi:MAG: L-threonylcarbamoyladenylate synthase [Thermoleophilia bacterium]|nr:L-threonylcarbamoyladenylate synthase [Thermoleophilia bacterium]
MNDAREMAAALAGGALALLPTDTVYGLVCVAASRDAALDLYRLKGRVEIQPTAVIAADTEVLLASIPGLEGIAAAGVRTLLPGPFTLVVPNRERRYSWLSAARPETIGVRVPHLVGPAAEIVASVGMIVATSANLPGGPDPCRIEDVPAKIRAGVAFAVDGGELPGTPSTVIDLSGSTPAVLRVGAGDPEQALARLAEAFTE